MSMFLSFWVLPIAFVLHDFEEMILATDWKRRDAATAGRIRRLFFGEVTHGPALCAGIAEEMLLLTAVSITCGVTHNTTVYLACCVAYTFHLLPHLAACPLTHGYVPGALTALIELPFMAWHIGMYWRAGTSPLATYLFWQATALAAVYANLALIHRAMPRIQNLLLDYAQGK